MAKILIAYFSHTGENYFGGQIRNITKGNTATVAEAAQRVTGGDLFEIRTMEMAEISINPVFSLYKRFEI